MTVAGRTEAVRPWPAGATAAVSSNVSAVPMSSVVIAAVAFWPGFRAPEESAPTLIVKSPAAGAAPRSAMTLTSSRAMPNREPGASACAKVSVVLAVVAVNDTLAASQVISCGSGIGRCPRMRERRADLDVVDQHVHLGIRIRALRVRGVLERDVVRLSDHRIERLR